MATQVCMRYTLDRPLTNEGAGYSLWGFGTKDGVSYFIKQFLSPKYPANDPEASPEQLAKRRRKCDAFVAQKKAIYTALNTGSDGNDVRVREFFRVGSRFYIAMDKVDSLDWTIETVHAQSDAERRRLCAVIAHAIWGLHRNELIHADLKHENILYTRTPSGSVTAKVIDFDNSYLEGSPPSQDEIVGDINYFAPETCARLNGVDAPLTRKVDIFALGVLFHQYFTGELPQFSREQYPCPGVAVLNGDGLTTDSSLPPDLAQLLGSMLQADPERRPSAWEVFCALRPGMEAVPEPPSEPAPAAATVTPVNVDPSSFFKKGGNLV